MLDGSIASQIKKEWTANIAPTILAVHSLNRCHKRTMRYGFSPHAVTTKHKVQNFSDWISMIICW